MPDFNALSKLFGGLKDLLSGVSGAFGSLGTLTGKTPNAALPPFLQQTAK